MLPGLMLQDSWRYAFFAARIGHHALMNDVLWAVVEIPVLLILKATGHVNVFWFVIAWGAGAAAGAVFGAFQARAVPNLDMRALMAKNPSRPRPAVPHGKLRWQWRFHAPELHHLFLPGP